MKLVTLCKQPLVTLFTSFDIHVSASTIGIRTCMALVLHCQVYNYTLIINVLHDVYIQGYS